MKFRILTTLSLFLFSLTGYAQLETAKKYADQIDSQRLKAVVTVLASDEYGGRDTGKDSGIKAANYITDYLKSIKVMPGNKNSYFQDIEAFSAKKVDGNVTIDGFPFDREGSYHNYPTMDSILTSNQVLFVGYGIYSGSYNDFAGIDITDKVIMIMQGEPYSKFGVRVSSYSEVKKLYAKQKPKAIINITEGFYSVGSYLSHDIYYYSNYNNEDILTTIPTLRVNELLANKILEQSGKTVKQLKYEIEQTGSPKSFLVEANLSALGFGRYEDAQANNIIGFIEGSDKKDEYLVLSAHYDHLGTRYNGDVYNGADDNASGVSALLEIANMMAKAKKEGKGPRRSLIFLFPTAEEKGLIGSKYYVTKPIYPLDKTVGCINLDMLGRISKEEKDNNYLNISRREKSRYDNSDPSGNLPYLLEWTNQKMTNKLKINVTDNYFSQSDHYNFVQKGIPGVMVTSGIHNDYHETTDDSDKIDYEGLHKRTQLIFYMAWAAANAIEIPKETIDIDPRSSNSVKEEVVEVEELQVLDRAANKY